MVEVDKIYEGKVAHTGVFDFGSLYSFLYEWLTEENSYAVIEKKYSEKLKGDAKDIDIEWEGYRKINDYFRLKIKVVWRLLGLKNVEVEENGKKRKMNQGIVEVKMSGFLEKDYENKWEENPLMKFLRATYDKFIIKNRIEQYEDKITGDVDGTLAQVKSFLSLEARH